MAFIATCVGDWVNFFERNDTEGSTGLGWAPALSGVTQGSVTGQLLFILYVNGMPDLVHCNVKMFTDDTKQYVAIKSRVDQEQLQSDIDTLED